MTQLTFPGLLPPIVPPPLPAGAPSPLIHYPHVSGAVRAGHAKRIGAAGERLVDSFLLRWGFFPCEAPEAEAFDRLVLIGPDLLRLQVKTVTHPRGGTFVFPMQQGYRRSPGGRHGYAEGAFDLAALVVLPANVVAFTAERLDRHHVPAAAMDRLRRKPQASFLDAIEAFRARRDLSA